MSAPSCRVAPGDTVSEAAYFEFARRAFGPDAYQALPSYLRWLYDESPLTRGRARDFHVAVTPDGGIAGCIHVMRGTWRAGNDIVNVSAPHNTMVLPEHRVGAGGLLIARALKSEPHVFVPGAVGDVSALLKRLGFETARTEWRSRWLRPMTGGLRIAHHRATGRTLPRRPASVASVRQRRDNGLHWVAESPASPSALEEIVAFANDCWAAPGLFAQHWTVALFFWRFFHPVGPRHDFLVCRRDGRLVGYVMLSLAMHRGVILARVVDARHSTDTDFGELMRVAAEHARRRGAHLLLAMTGEDRQRAGLDRLGWRGWSRSPETLIRHQRSSLPPEGAAFAPSAGDYGFEAIVA